MKKHLYLLLASSTLSFGAFAQTGMINSTIPFNGANRQLSYFVPSNYVSGQPVKLMVGLHGLGDNSTNFRTALVNQRNFEAAFPNTILLCPDGGSDPNKDFYMPAGDEEIITLAIAHAKQNYTIDTTNIYLEGFSLGGRSALRYALDYPNTFKGVLLNTPAIQGVREADNLSANFSFNYQNASQFPIFITFGVDDVLYEGPIQKMVHQLAHHNAIFNYAEFVGGHTVPYLTNYSFDSFFNHKTLAPNDASVFEVKTPNRVCNNDLPVSVLLQNKGNNALTGAKISYGIGTNLQSYQWQGNLAPHESVEVTLPSYALGSITATGAYEVSVSIDSINGNNLDTVAHQNTASTEAHVMKNALTMPWSEDFSNESTLNTWKQIVTGDYYLPLILEEEALYSLNTIFVFDNSGNREEIITPNFDLSNQTSAHLQFDVDYNYVKYTAAVLGVDSIFADSLEVFVSTDCGATYTSMFKKGGTELSGHASPVENPLSLNAMVLPKDPASYRNFTIDASAYAGNDNVHFKFSYISNLGGYIYLDNMQLNNTAVSTNELAKISSGIQVFPNPNDGLFTVSLNQGNIDMIQVFNVMGQLVKSQRVQGLAADQINISDLAAGQYLINVTSGNQMFKTAVIKK